MAIRSMTGYGRSGGEYEGWHLLIELRSVNHRGLDVRIMTPPSLSAAEPSVRKVVRNACGRGRVECRLSLEPPGQEEISPATLDRAQHTYQLLEAVHDHLGLTHPIGLEHLLAGGLSLAPGEEQPPEALVEYVVTVAQAALTRLVEARETEGEVLRAEFLSRLERVLDTVDGIEVLALEEAERNRSRLAERLGDILRESRESGVVDEERLKHEVVTSLDRSDITEEVVRARAHAQNLHQLFSAGNPSGKPVGKRVDFFLQELIREANTMGSKSASAELTARVVDVKVEIERMREQANNIE